MQSIAAYIIVGIVALLALWMIWLFIGAIRYQQKYDGAELPDLDIGEHTEEDDEDDEKELPAFDLSFDGEETPADEMFTIMNQQPKTRRERQKQEEKASMFAKFSKK